MCGSYLIVVNARLRTAGGKSHYATSSKLEQELSVEAATRNSRYSRPSDRVSCGRRWHFRKPA